MSKIIKWIIAIAVGLIITAAVSYGVFYFIFYAYHKKVNKTNQQVIGYINDVQNETSTEEETSSYETRNYGIDVEELPTEYAEETFIYWDPDDDRDQVYFKSSALIVEDGFLPYDILGQLNVFLKDKIRGFHDSSNEMIIDDARKTEFVSVIYFHTENGKYTYRYDWDTELQELLEDN